MELIKYRDSEMNAYTFFWVEHNKTVSPYFNNEDEANNWLHDFLGGSDKAKQRKH